MNFAFKFFRNSEVCRYRCLLLISSLLLLHLLLIGGCTPDKTDDPDIPIGFPLAGTEWESSGSRLLRFIDNDVATYRNSGNSYVLDYEQKGNDVVFTISGNSSPDWTGIVNETGTMFTLYKDEYTVVFSRLSGKH